MGKKYSIEDKVWEDDLIEVIGTGSNNSTRKRHKRIQSILGAGEWESLGYGSGYGAQTFGYDPAFKVVGDMVFLRGTAKKSSGNISNLDIPYGVLPLHARPSTVTYFVAKGAGSTIVVGQINADGSIVVLTSGTTDWMSLDSVSFSR